MNLLFCGDENVADGVLLSAMSVAEQVMAPLQVFLFTAAVEDGAQTRRPISARFAKRLEAVLRKINENSRVVLCDLTELFAARLPLANMNTRFTPLCMLRLYADLVAEIPERVLYLDSDVLCRGDFSDFYHQDMTDVEIAGSLDRYGRWFFNGGPLRQRYLNSGVLLMNMEQIRAGGLLERCRGLCRDRKMLMPDQTALNRLAKKRILPRRYNEQGAPRPDTVFQHFSTRFRFWPYIHTQTVKPWEIEKVHHILGQREYDRLYAHYLQEKETEK